MKGTVTTPVTPQRPTGYIWTALDGATTVAELDQLDHHASIHGYAPDGQARRAIAEKRALLAGEG